METEDLDIKEEILNNIGVNNLINLKEEIDDLVLELDSIIEICDTAINQ